MLDLLQKVLRHAEHWFSPEFLHNAAAKFLIPANMMDVLSIVLIDLILAGDNAVVIALAVQSLSPRQRRFGILLGATFAVALRIVLTFFAAKLLATQYIKLLGGAFIFWIAVKLLIDSGGADGGAKKAGGVWQAMWMIVVADITMSTDNILAVAAASKGRASLLIFGLALSIPFVIFTSGLLSVLMSRYKWIVWAGAALLGKVGAEMIFTDKFVSDHFYIAEPLLYFLQAAGAALVILLGWKLAPKAPGT